MAEHPIGLRHDIMRRLRAIGMGKCPQEPPFFRTSTRACALPLLCRFLDAGMTAPSTRCGGRRPKSAKARSRGKLGTGGATGAMGI